MAKVACFEIEGLKCWFWSNDHNPPHFHVKRNGEWEIKVNFLEGDDMFKLKWGDWPRSKVLKQIWNAVTANRDALLAEWEAQVNQ
jgi:hypothetical protein